MARLALINDIQVTYDDSIPPQQITVRCQYCGQSIWTMDISGNKWLKIPEELTLEKIAKVYSDHKCPLNSPIQ